MLLSYDHSTISNVKTNEWNYVFKILAHHMGNLGLGINFRRKKNIEEMVEEEGRGQKCLKTCTTAMSVSFKGIPIRNGRVLKTPDGLTKYQKRKSQQSSLN